MLSNIPIKKLYVLALAEGEGVGTAYEYYAKRLLLSSWLANFEPPSRILVAGLPQKYGASLDFLLLAAELDAGLTIVDERPAAITRCEAALTSVQKMGQLADLNPRFLLTQDVTTLPELNDTFDLALSSEVLQRLPEMNRLPYMWTILDFSAKFALFTPNGDNPAHTNLSGLAGLRLEDLEHLSELAARGSPLANHRFGYIDMPPFPPGITRTEDQREQASTGTGEAFAMWGLAYYARMERWLPKRWRLRKSHIVYAFLNGSQR